ncbi:MAG: MFS transporter, partial [Pseudomonadota bacterium]
PAAPVKSEQQAGPLRLFIIGTLNIAHELPAALLTILAPTFFVKTLDMPVEYVGVFSIPLFVTALKWLWAPLVDAYGHDAFGRRRSWIVPTSLVVSLLYVIIASIDPSLETLPFIIALFVLVKIAFSTYEIAIDAYVVEALGSNQRGYGAAAVWFGKEVGQIAGLAGTLYLADRFGWSVAFLAAAIGFSFCNAVVMLRREVPQSEAAAMARKEGRRAKISSYVKKQVNRRVLLLTLCFAFAVQMVPAIIGPFLASRGLSLAEVGIAVGLAASVGAGISLATASVVVARLGAKRTTMFLIPICLVALPVFLWLASTEAPSILVVAFAIFIGAICTAPVRMVFYAARLGWTSKTQVGTDFTIQQSVWFLGYGLALIFSGILASKIGWVGFFLVNASLTLSVMLAFIFLHDTIEKEIQKARAEEGPS